MNKLQRTSNDNLIGGVFGGFGRYFKIDASFLRTGYVLLILFGDDVFKTAIIGSILFAFYIICWIVISED